MCFVLQDLCCTLFLYCCTIKKLLIHCFDFSLVFNLFFLLSFVDRIFIFIILFIAVQYSCSVVHMSDICPVIHKVTVAKQFCEHGNNTVHMQIFNVHSKTDR